MTYHFRFGLKDHFIYIYAYYNHKLFIVHSFDKTLVKYAKTAGKIYNTFIEFFNKIKCPRVWMQNFHLTIYLTHKKVIGRLGNVGCC